MLMGVKFLERNLTSPSYILPVYTERSNPSKRCPYDTMQIVFSTVFCGLLWRGDSETGPMQEACKGEGSKVGGWLSTSLPLLPRRTLGLVQPLRVVLYQGKSTDSSCALSHFRLAALTLLGKVLQTKQVAPCTATQYPQYRLLLKINFTLRKQAKFSMIGVI